MLIRNIAAKETVLIRLNPGDDILQSLRKAVADQGIKNGLILTGVGSVRAYHYHVVDGFDLPPPEAFARDDKPLDVVNVNGLIISGRVHAHITFADAKAALGGHMEEGCIVLTFAVIAVCDLGEVDLSGWDSIACL